MALLDIVERLLQPLFDKLKQVLAPFNKLIGLVGRFFDNFKTAFNNGNALAGEVVNEINEWRNFRENINVKNRVISLPKAIEQTQALLDEIRNAWSAIADLAKQLKGEFEETSGGNPTEEAEQAIADIENSGFKGVIEKFPRLFKGLEKVLGFVAIAIDALEHIAAAINDLKAIVDAIRDIREEIETGSTIFLKSNNPRRIVHLDDGTSMKIRVGNLHS